MNKTAANAVHPSKEWVVGGEAWAQFARENALLGLGSSQWQFVNFLRHAKAPLVAADAIRKAKNRFWICHRERFPVAAFELLTRPVKREGV